MACRIYSYEGFDCFLDVAANIFDDFVKNFTKDFGIQNTTWKIHAVSHMVDEVKRHGVFKKFQLTSLKVS